MKMRMFALMVAVLSQIILLERSSGHGFDVLIFSKTSGFRHDSIATGTTTLQSLGTAHSFGVNFTEDASTFVSLLPFHEVVIFLNTSGDILDEQQQTAFQDWYRAGGGFVGIHSAADTEHDWPWYLEMLGAEFDSHPAVQEATIEFLDQVHPITNVIDPETSQRVTEWNINEEWYNFVANPRGQVHVLANLEEDSYTGGTMGDDHPIAWCQEFEGGRSAYLSPGHTTAIYAEPIYQDLLTNAIEWAAGESAGDSGATVETNYEKVVLESNLASPMAIDIAPDGKIYLVERKGAVKVHDESTGVTSTIGMLAEYSGGEYGLIGIALAPDFATSKHLYIHWSPASGTNTRVSRFTLNTAGNLDLGSEEVIIEYLSNRPTQTGNSGHHQSGCLRFDTNGHLFISIGDNTQASPYSPRFPDLIGRDARKSSPNTNDLRGKILRITPEVGAGPSAHPNYTIPPGNLFPPGTPLAREEIYLMGCRNCFRFCLDPFTGWLYYGDVGPDAGGNGSNAEQGPRGHDEFNQVKEPGWFGWPYFLADNQAYLDSNANEWTMATLRADLANYFTLPSFTSSGALAGDPNLLPEPLPAWIWYPNGANSAPAQFTELNATGGRCAMAGAVYDYSPGKNFPAYFERSVFLMEWSRNKLLEVKTREDGSILEITEFAPHLTFVRPIEMVFGPNGAMYLIEWGESFGSGESASTALVKIQYGQSNSTPVAIAAADVSSGPLPLTVSFSSVGSFDADGGNLDYAWDFDGDQIIDSTDPNPIYTYTTAGTYAAQLSVTDAGGLLARASVVISAGNSAPTVVFEEPLDYSFFDWGDVVAYSFSVSDPEDGSSDSGAIGDGDVLLEGALGHADHQHNELQVTNLAGSILIPRDDSHAFDFDLAYVFDASYTDQGAPGVSPIVGSSKVVLQPKVTMAQTYDDGMGVTTATTADPVGGELDVVGIDDGDFLVFEGLNLNRIDAIRLRAAGLGGGTVEVRNGSPLGELLASIAVPAGTGSDYGDYTAGLLSVPSSEVDLYFVFKDFPGALDLFKLNWIAFRGQGSTLVPGRPAVDAVFLEALGEVAIRFDQTMDRQTLADLANYSMDGGAVLQSVVPWPSQLGVNVTFSNAVDGNYYNLSIAGLEDLAGDEVAAGTAVTVFNAVPAVSEFVLGLNIGGPDYTDASGQFYLADTSTYLPAGSSNAATLLVDFQSRNGVVVTSTASDFAEGDASISTDSTVNVINSNNPSSVAVTATGLTGVTISHTGANGIFNTSKGSYDGLPIFDGYLFETAVFGDAADSELTIAGLAGVEAGKTMTLTLWGVGDTADSDATFEVLYNGVTVGTQSTDYEGGAAAARVQFTIVKVAGADAITVNWGEGGASTTALNGFSLTVPGEAPVPYLFGGGVLTSTTDSIAGTADEALYQTERWKSGNFGYQIPVENGSYEVVLKFAEIFFNAPGLRSFDVSVEGAELFEPDLDIFSEVGHDFAADYLIENVIVTDGVLDIEYLLKGVNNPKASALAVFSVGPGSDLPVPSFAHYLTQNPESRFNATADIDGDGLVTLFEYALGGDDQGADVGLLPSLQESVTVVGDFDLVFSRVAGLPDVSFVVEATEDLSSSESWIPVAALLAVDAPGSIEGVRFENLRAAAQSAGLEVTERCFFRLRLELMEPAE